MHPETYQRERRRLAERLRSLRERAGLSGNQFAARRGWVQPRVSRIETGKQLPTEADLQAWAETAGAGAEERGELAELLRRAHAEYANWRETFRGAGGAAAAQADIGERERAAARLRIFVPAMVPGLLQTTAYAQELLSLPTGPAAHGATEDDIAGMVARRMQRQQVLYEHGRQVEIVVMEAALRSRLTSAGTLAGQLDRLATAATAGFGFGVIPFEAHVPVYPLSGFTVYDDDLVTVETMSGEQHLSGPEDVANYARFFGLLRDSAATGRDAVAVIQRALTGLQRHTDTEEPPGAGA